ncbi:hypothetical protein HMPREF0970_02266 [Schaalia odontolytica F0309]|uniref:Uncharacterized protein n=1 Tax=Schaalia odontolytica F0309 TaxID=649742 RepID=D4U211_9ACTO|nr:hypothetical protein HMPREF0970_02266 [Schaalia odontolytica F0309]
MPTTLGTVISALDSVVVDAVDGSASLVLFLLLGFVRLPMRTRPTRTAMAMNHHFV